MTVCSYYVTYAFQSESTLYSCLNVRELLARRRREIWSLSDCNWTRTHNYLVHKRTLSHLAKLASFASLAKWLSVRLWTKWLWVRVQLQAKITSELALRTPRIKTLVVNQRSFIGFFQVFTARNIEEIEYQISSKLQFLNKYPFQINT